MQELGFKDAHTPGFGPQWKPMLFHMVSWQMATIAEYVWSSK